MGSFGGHALPGSFFIVFGLWWTLQTFHRYYKARAKNTKFTSSSIFSCSCLCGRLRDWPLEAYLKLLCTGVGIFVEIREGFLNHCPYGCPGNRQHATMFFFFGLTGIMDILKHYKFPFPPNMDYVSLAMALLVECVLFMFHLHGRKDMDVLLHTLLIYTIAAEILAVLLEMKDKNSVLCVLSRAYFGILQGTWFWQIGWILYPPFPSSYKWDLEDHDQMMIATTIFAWHAAVNFLVMLAIGGVMSCIHRKQNSYKSLEDGYAMAHLINTSNEDHVTNGDSESDFEFESKEYITDQEPAAPPPSKSDFIT